MTNKVLSKNTADLQQKKRGRPFKKGVSGNENGRPKGSRNFRTVFEEALKEIKDIKTNKSVTEKDFVRVYLQKALMGEGRNLEHLIDRLYGKSREVIPADEVDDIKEINIVFNRLYEKPNR